MNFHFRVMASYSIVSLIISHLDVLSLEIVSEGDGSKPGVHATSFILILEIWDRAQFLRATGQLSREGFLLLRRA